MWCGTYKKGVCCYHENLYKFNKIRIPYSPVIEENFSDINDVNAVVEDSKGNLWIGTNGAGLLYYDVSTETYRMYTNKDNLSSNVIVSLALGEDGRLWIGSFLGGLDCYDGKSFRHIELPDYPSPQSIYSILSVKDNVWFGTLDRGVYGLSSSTNEITHVVSGSTGNILGDNIYSMAYLGDDEVLLGTATGLKVLNTKTYYISKYVLPEGVTTSPMPVFVDSRGMIWFNNGKTLVVYEPTNGHYETFKDVKQVLSINEDEKGNIWAGTKNGLFRVLVEQTDGNSDLSFNTSAYTMDDGLPGLMFNGNSTYYTKDKELIFGTTDGLAVFNSSMIKSVEKLSKIKFTSLVVGNESIEPGQQYNGKVILDKDISEMGKISLPSDLGSFSLQVSAIKYLHPEKLQYYYKIDDLNPEWIRLESADRRISYANLPIGNHILRVKAVMDDDISQSEEAVMEIQIMPPFYLSVWSVFIYIVLILIILYFIVRSIVRIQNRKHEAHRVQMEEEHYRKLDQMKLQFMMNISHEFKTPLTMILSPIDSLMKMETDEKRIKLYKLISHNANRLLDLVNQLLDFRKIDARGDKLKLSSGDIVLFVRNATYAFSEIASQKNIKLIFSSIFHSLIMTYDSEKILKVVGNLLSNAFKFTPNGGSITVSLSTKKKDDGESDLIISVKDSGIGIAPEYQEAIFERFYQVPGVNENSGGTGIGLHICKEFVKLHDGTISVNSGLGMGSEFVVTLPICSNVEEVVVDSESENENPQLNHEHHDLPRRKNMRKVCVVDDNIEFLDFMIDALSPFYNVLTAADGEKAWALIQEELPDLVISDIMMPKIDGIDLCRNIKSTESTSEIPIILLSAKSSDQSKMEGFEVGADEYMTKPFNIDILLIRMKHLIDLKGQITNSSVNTIKLNDVEVSSDDKIIVENLVQYIESHVSDSNLSVTVLCEEMGMSKGTLYKKTSDVLGKKPLALIRAIRMRKAAQLLKNSEKRVSEVMYEVGVNDVRLFRKYFKEEFGVLPSEYLNKNKT
jgi:signal transduction histidine kinase/CheY-like chemotaxis protein